jgi:predicted Zn-dependent peptidase
MRYLFVSLILLGAVLQAAQPIIPIEKYSLKNGMRVILSRDNAVPVVSVYVMYDVGARAEERAAPDSLICSNT